MIVTASILSFHDREESPGENTVLMIPMSTSVAPNAMLFREIRIHIGARRYRIANKESTPGVNGSKRWDAVTLTRNCAIIRKTNRINAFRNVHDD